MGCNAWSVSRGCARDQPATPWARVLLIIWAVAGAPTDDVGLDEILPDEVVGKSGMNGSWPRLVRRREVSNLHAHTPERDCRRAPSHDA